MSFLLHNIFINDNAYITVSSLFELFSDNDLIYFDNIIRLNYANSWLKSKITPPPELFFALLVFL